MPAQILILIFAEVLGLYGLIVALIMNTNATSMEVSLLISFFALQYLTDLYPVLIVALSVVSCQTLDTMVYQRFITLHGHCATIVTFCLPNNREFPSCASVKRYNFNEDYSNAKKVVTSSDINAMKRTRAR